LIIIVPLVVHPAADAFTAVATSRQQDAMSILRLRGCCALCIGFISKVLMITKG
jgi:hypothetical protein